MSVSVSASLVLDVNHVPLAVIKTPFFLGLIETSRSDTRKDRVNQAGDQPSRPLRYQVDKPPFPESETPGTTNAVVRGRCELKQ